MNRYPTHVAQKINKITSAWEALRPTKSFAGMTLKQFKDNVQPSFAARSKVAVAQSNLIAAQNERDDADKLTLAKLRMVVNAVKGDPKEGDDGDLYDAMGYVRRSDRKSGLKRPRRKVPGTPES